MIKFVVLCAVVSLCMARSLNDDVPQAVVTEEVIVAEMDASELSKPKDVAEDVADGSDLAAAIDSNSGDVIDSDKTRFLFRFTTTTTTTTPLPMNQKIDLLLTLNSVATAGG